MKAPNDGKMGIWMTTAFVIGSAIGVAIFMLPIALAPLGINAVIAWVISGIGAFCLAVPLGLVARHGHGTQAAIENTFGPTMGFVVAWAFWVSCWSGAASVAVGAASTISRVIPGFDPWAVAVIAASFIAITGIVNARGARASGTMAIVIVVLRSVPLAAVVVLATIKAGTHQPLQPLWNQPITLNAIATATALTLFAFTGFENVTAPVGKIRDPERVIPRALLFALSAIALIYLSTSTSVTLLLPADEVARSPAPFADAIGASWGNAAAYVVAAGIAISAFGCIGCATMGAGELFYAMALKGDLPKVLARTNGHHAPALSQAISTGLAMILVLSNSSRSTAGLYVFISLLSSVAVLILYVVAALAALVSERKIGIRLLAVAGVLFAAFAFYGSGSEALLWGLGLAASAIPVRVISRWLSGSSLRVAATPAAIPESFS